MDKIFSYWEGKKPDYIKMCQEILYKNAGDFEIVILDSCENPFNLAINQKVDFLKANLIAENGGFWIDADMIVMKDLKPLLKLLDKSDFIGIPGFFGAKKKAPILIDWINAMNEIISADLSFSDLIKPLLDHPMYKPYKYLTHEMITPIWHTEDEFPDFFSSKQLADFVTHNTYIVTLYNSLFTQEFKSMTGDEILSKDWLISRMFKKAL